MRPNPLATAYFELLQTLPRDTESFYALLVDTHGRCPWLAAACYHNTWAEGESRNTALQLAYLNADHRGVAKERRDAFVRKVRDANLTPLKVEMLGRPQMIRIPGKAYVLPPGSPFYLYRDYYPWETLAGPKALSRIFHWRTL